MRQPAAPVLVAMLVAVALAGCADAGDECSDPPPARAVVEAISDRDASVRMADGEPAVLHLSAAVFFDDGAGCAMVGPAGVRVGDTLAFQVDVWAESYPMQGWPETAIILRG